MSTPHAALARNAAGGLEIAHFPTAAEAATASLNRELPKPGRMLDHLTLARRAGVPSRVVRAAYRRGVFPGAVQHQRDYVMVPAHYVRLLQVHGVCGLERMARAGRLTAEGGENCRLAIEDCRLGNRGGAR